MMLAILNDKVYRINQDETMHLVFPRNLPDETIPIPYGNPDLIVDASDSDLDYLGYFSGQEQSAPAPQIHPVSRPRKLNFESMNTPATAPAKATGVAAFLGEAASAPEASVTTTITGTPTTVQRAIAKLAKKPGARKPGAPAAAVPKLDDTEGVDDIPVDDKPAPGGGEEVDLEIDDEPPIRGGRPAFESKIKLRAAAANIVEGLIQGDDTPAK